MEVAVQAPLVLLVCADGLVKVEANDQIDTLDSLDTAVLDQAPETLSISSDGVALMYVIEIHRLK